MIPILFDDGERNYNTNGLGRLADIISCIVTEERNGEYECQFELPITSEKYPILEEGQQILCTHDDTGDTQPFIIYGRTAPINGIVTFYAHHVSYALRSTVVMPFTASSITNAFNKIGQNCLPEGKFTFWTNKSTVGNFSVKEPRAARGLLGGEEGSILDVYGTGEYLWDRYTVKLYTSRGSDSDVEIRYGKNLSDITNEIDAADTYNAVVPFWYDEDSGALVTLPEKYIYNSAVGRRTAFLTDENETILREEGGEPLEATFTLLQAIPLDLSEEFEEKPTVAQLRTSATTKLMNSDGWVPTQNITVDFVHLWETEEYKNYAPLQRVSLCDTVSVYYPELGVEAEKKKVVRTVYNVLADRYDEIELGDLQYSYGEIIARGILEDVPTRDMMAEAIEHATDLISGGLGGYVILKPNANGQPEEILIMDTPDTSTAVNVIRMNKNGIAFSNSGYSGPFHTAWTIDGAFVADFITSGVLNANIIKAGVLSDEDGNTTFDLETGELDISTGSIDLGNGAFTVDDYGDMTANSINIGGFKLTDAVDGNYALYQDKTVNGIQYRTWIRTATSDDGGGATYALSIQIKNGSNWVIPFVVSSAGEITVNPAVSASSNVLSDYYIEATKSHTVFAGPNSLVENKANGLTIVTGRSTTAHFGNLYITADGLAYYGKEGSSSRKIKKDISEVTKKELLAENLYNADVIQYKYRDDFLDDDDENRGKDLVGFIVEDLDKVYPIAVQKEDPEESKTWTWSPYRMIPPMLQLIQDQKKEIEELKKEIKSIKEVLNEDKRTEHF